jgi:porin
LGGNSRLPGREDDRFGIGWYYLGISDELGPVLAGLLDEGQGVELYYDIAISERCRLALDLQVVEPNAVGADTALVPGIRSHVEF